MHKFLTNLNFIYLLFFYIFHNETKYSLKKNGKRKLIEQDISEIFNA